MGKTHYSNCKVAEFCCIFLIVCVLLMGMRGPGSGLKIIFDWTRIVFCWNHCSCMFFCISNWVNMSLFLFREPSKHSLIFLIEKPILNNRFSLIYQVRLRLVCCQLQIIMFIVFSLNSVLWLFIRPYFMENC